MADDRKNPLLGAFRSTAPGAAPPSGTTASKRTEENKPTEQAIKPTPETKTVPTAGTSAPAKTDEKKTAEPAKPTADTKAAPTTDTPAPVKPDEPPKPAADSKTAPAIGTDPTAEPDVEIPKNFTLPIAKAGQSELITTLKVAEIHPFEGHPFSVKDDKNMWDLVESVKQFGVLEPITVIPRKEGGYAF